MHVSSFKYKTLVAHLLIIAAVFLEQINAINIQTGDTLARIAAEQGVSVAALEAANPGISVNDLQPGQVLSVPAPGSATTLIKSTTTTSRSSTSTSSTSKSSTSKSSTSTSSTSTSSSSSSSQPPKPPPTTTPTPASPTSSIADITNIGTASCAPSPIGQYSDANDVSVKTDAFCDANGKNTLEDLLAAPLNGLLSGDSQEDNSDDGNGGLASNEKGFNMTISAVPGCVYPAGGEFTVGQPMGTTSGSDWWCQAVLTNCYNECNNQGMGGQLQAGCFLYVFEPDP